MDMPMEQEEELQNVDPDSEEGSANKGGYYIELHVKPDGTFGVAGPIMKEYPSEESEAKEEGESAESLPDAIKLMLKIHKENPVEQNDMADLEAGFAAGPGAKSPY